MIFLCTLPIFSGVLWLIFSTSIRSYSPNRARREAAQETRHRASALIAILGLQSC